MIFLAGMLLGACAALVIHRTLAGLADVAFRNVDLLVAGFVIQVVLFSSWWHNLGLDPRMDTTLYIISLLLVGVFCWLNRQVRGIPLLGLGWALNAVAILANGGAMPASLDALRTAGLADDAEAALSAVGSNSRLIGPDTPLWFFGDIFAIPAHWPLANVFSVGDAVLGIGGAWFIFTHGAPPRTAPHEATSPIR